MKGHPAVEVKQPALTVTDAAREGKTSKKLIYEEIARGNLKAVRLGKSQGTFRLTRENFDDWMAGRRSPVDQRIAEIIASSPPLTDAQVDEIVAIIRAERVAV